MFFINVDMSDLFSLNGMTDAAKKAMQEQGTKLAAMTRAHIAERAAEVLHTRRGMFVEALTHFQVDESTWVVNLDASVRWIDEGMPEHNMLDALLKSKGAKRAKDGSTYVVVPFKHGPKGKTEMTPAQATLLQTIKSELKQRDIPYAKIEKDDQGNAKLGKLHSFNINDQPIKTENKPGQGKGPIGAVMQGPPRLSHGGTRMKGTPLLSGVSIYQKKGADGKVKRSIMTFRIASSKHKEEGGRWEHPGLPPTNLMQEGYEWAMKTWERDIAPQVMAKFIASLN